MLSYRKIRLQTLTSKYRIYPNQVTEAKLQEALETCRWLYNRLLEDSSKARGSGKPLNKYDMQNMIPQLKKENTSLDNVYSKVLQMVSYTLWGNICGLSQLRMNGRHIGHIRFKGIGWYKTLNYNQSGFSFNNNTLHLSKIGDIRIKIHRPIDGKVKAVIIKHEGNRWYALIQMDTEIHVMPKNDHVVGIDVGLKSFVVDSDGNSFDHPRYLGKMYSHIKVAQRNLSRKKKGSNNRDKARGRLAKLFDKINNQRNDFLHKVSRYYVNSYGKICIEDLDVKGLLEKGHNNGMHRNIHDAAWSRFIMMVEYKAESAGRQLIKVEAKGTTQRCSKCGKIVPKELKDRVHECPYCGLKIDRDYNAAMNILIAGLGQPKEPVELKPILCLTAEQALAMKQETTDFRPW
jgi:putative transposase